MTNISQSFIISIFAYMEIFTSAYFLHIISICLVIQTSMLILVIILTMFQPLYSIVFYKCLPSYLKFKTKHFIQAIGWIVLMLRGYFISDILTSFIHLCQLCISSSESDHVIFQPALPDRN